PRRGRRPSRLAAATDKLAPSRRATRPTARLRSRPHAKTGGVEASWRLRGCQLQGITPPFAARAPPQCREARRPAAIAAPAATTCVCTSERIRTQSATEQNRLRRERERGSLQKSSTAPCRFSASSRRLLERA